MFQIGKRRLGKQRSRSIRARAGLHGDERVLRRGDEAESIATIHRALELGVISSTRPTCTGRSRTRSWSAARSATAATGRAGHQVRQSCAARDGEFMGVDGEPSTCARPATPASSGSASTTSTSTTSTAWTRTCRSRRRSARWRELVRRARCATSVSREAAPRDDPPCACGASRSPRCRPSTRCGPASRRTGAADRAASSASASSPTARSAAAS